MFSTLSLCAIEMYIDVVCFSEVISNMPQSLSHDQPHYESLKRHEVLFSRRHEKIIALVRWRKARKVWMEDLQQRSSYHQKLLIGNCITISSSIG